jgi:very-short-patch-repair endonuclease
VINRAKENDRSYYLIDYYIPTKGIAIELDSNLHDKKFDQIKDRYLFRYHGIRVIRYPNILKDFRLCVEDLRRNIHLLPDNYITFNYSDIIEDYIRSKTRHKPPKP